MGNPRSPTEERTGQPSSARTEGLREGCTGGSGDHVTGGARGRLGSTDSKASRNRLFVQKRELSERGPTRTQTRKTSSPRVSCRRSRVKGALSVTNKPVTGTACTGRTWPHSPGTRHGVTASRRPGTHPRAATRGHGRPRNHVEGHASHVGLAASGAKSDRKRENATRGWTVRAPVSGGHSRPAWASGGLTRDGAAGQPSPPPAPAGARGRLRLRRACPLHTQSQQKEAPAASGGACAPGDFRRLRPPVLHVHRRFRRRPSLQTIAPAPAGPWELGPARRPQPRPTGHLLRAGSWRTAVRSRLVGPALRLGAARPWASQAPAPRGRGESRSSRSRPPGSEARRTRDPGHAAACDAAQPDGAAHRAAGPASRRGGT